MNKDISQKRWKLYGKISSFALIRGIPKTERDNKKYYKAAVFDSLFTSFTTYILLVIGISKLHHTPYNGKESFLLATLIIIVYSQTSNIVRVIYYKEKWYTNIILLYNLYQLSGYLLIYMMALILGWV